jgi:SpoVK/Ycf46/Vps4 family AAA+-type ATPase
MLLDEVDCVLDKEGNVKNLLLYIDQVRRAKNCVLIMTTNHLDKLPEAVLRKGRVTEVIEVLPWTIKDAKKFCALHSLNVDESPHRDGKYYAGDLIEWAQELILNRLTQNE